MVRLEGQITEDGHLELEVPPDLPRGRVVVMLEPNPVEEIELSEADLQGLGLTAEEIARSPEIGAWAGASELSGAEYVESLRGASPRFSW